jgi:SAM-dependent methyltransferase
VPDYWDQHYKQFAEDRPSPFCLNVLSSVISTDDHVVELGCGNGRDGVAIAQRCAHYTGIDLAHSAIETSKARMRELAVPEKRFDFMAGDFSTYDIASLKVQRLVIYSRFSLHAITASQEQQLIDHLNSYTNGPIVVLIECRTVFDDLFGVGDEVERNAFMTDHFRRFIDPTEFIFKMKQTFELQDLQIANDFAPYGDEDPIVMRARFIRGQL